MTGSNIHPLKFQVEFTICKSKIKVFFRIDFEIMLCIKYGFELPRNKDGEELEEHKWTTKQREEFMANGKT